MLEMSGTTLNRVAYPDVFQETAGNGFITHTDTLRDQPDLLARFARAYTKGQIACQANPEFCVKAFWRANPQSRPANADSPEVLKDTATLVSRRVNRVLMKKDGQPRVPGQYDLQSLRANIQVMADAGEYPSANVPVENIFSNELISKINDFDAEAVREKARNAK